MFGLQRITKGYASVQTERPRGIFPTSLYGQSPPVPLFSVLRRPEFESDDIASVIFLTYVGDFCVEDLTDGVSF
jgi:hypothetical protein